MNVVIAISGLHGSGKSTYARSVANEFNLRHVSTGEFFRQIAMERQLTLAEFTREAEKKPAIDRLLDERIKTAIKKGNVVVDGLLAGWNAMGFTALKIYLSASFQTRINRIATRDTISSIEAEKITTLREHSEKGRFKKLYGIEIDDLSIYDLVLNTGLLSQDHNMIMIKSFIKEYIVVYGGG